MNDDAFALHRSLLFTVMIGIDPHKASHTAVAVDGSELEVGRLKVRGGRRQGTHLPAWAEAFEQRTWAIESANGLGYLLAQQLLTAGERVVDVPATLAARVRVLSSGKSGKNDPNDAHSVALAALRAPTLAEVRPRTTSPSCACWPSVTPTSAGGATRCAVGCTLSLPSSCRWHRQGNRCHTSGFGPGAHPTRGSSGG